MPTPLSWASPSPGQRLAVEQVMDSASICDRADPVAHRYLVTVVIPTHLSEPTALGRVSLAQTLAVLGRHPITFVVPRSLDVQWYRDFCEGKAEVHFERFDWPQADGVDRLLLSAAFFERFAAYEYVLSCHLDAFVYQDDLIRWCHQGYDYIGSVVDAATLPEAHPHAGRGPWMDHWLRWMPGKAPVAYGTDGGFALRRVQSFLRAIRRFRAYIGVYALLAPVRGKDAWEEAFVLRHFCRWSEDFMVPPRDIAQRFGTRYIDYDDRLLEPGESAPAALPFGAHGWGRYQLWG